MSTFEIIMYPCALKPPFNHLNSTLRNQLSLVSSITIVIFLKIEQGERRTDPTSALPSPTYPIQIHLSPHHLPLYNVKVRSTPKRVIPRFCPPLEECFPCVSRNIFSLHAPCSSFRYFQKPPRSSHPLRR